MVSGATGWGLSRNVKQLYGELARVYKTGDRIFLFGFSRGAFTVRTLAGFITTCGIVDPTLYSTNKEFWQAVKAAYKAYRRKYQTRVSRWLHGEIAVDPAQLRVTLGSRPPLDPHARLIEFVGVWDTVDAVGLPILASEFINEWVYRFKFKDNVLSPQVRHAYHALAADEQRESFAPVLWDERKKDEDQSIEQVWFAGVHSNVGGGYPRQGLSLVALDWMMTKAESCGLQFIDADRAQYRTHTDVDDKLYDSRRGFGVFYRWRPRDIDLLCSSCGVAPRLHRSLFERIGRATDDYAPGSLPPSFTLESTTLPGPSIEAVERLVAGHHQSMGMPLMRKHSAWVRFGRLSYWLFVYAVMALAVMALLSGNIGEQGWFELAWNTVRNHLVITGVLVLALGMGMAADAHLDRLYSAFWHELRDRLNAALDGRSAGAQLRKASGE